MNEYQLSLRLERVAGYLLQGKAFADIGSDHAFLPCYAYLKGMIPSAIAGEVNAGPYLSAKRQVEKLGLTSVISVRKGDGLSIIHKNEVQQVVIAGMGGGLICHILDEGKRKLKNVERLILQPNIASEKVRKWLHTNQWRLIQEEILEEDGKIYEILIAIPGEVHGLYKNDNDPGFVLGPYLMKERTDVFRKKWMMEMEKKMKILERMKNASPSDKMESKKNVLKQEIQIIKEAIT